MTQPLKIIVDHREPPEIKKRLIKLGMEIKEEQLDIADYVLSDTVACERKTGADLISSLMDNRLFEQIDRLIETYDQPILILENLEKAFERTEWKKRKKHVFGALTYIFLRRQVPVVPTTRKSETAILLNRIASWTQEEKTDPLIARKSPKKRTLRDDQLFFLQGLYNTGQKKGEILLDSFGNSPEEVLNSILQTKVVYTKTGNPKGLEGPMESLEGFGPKYVMNNQRLLKSSVSENSKK
ncbi:MAG: ERCC4 domain-containing protein [Candidatus Hodarchaeales archaeon]|jgi:Fanconi anemia group M protein